MLRGRIRRSRERTHDTCTFAELRQITRLSRRDSAPPWSFDWVEDLRSDALTRMITEREEDLESLVPQMKSDAATDQPPDRFTGLFDHALRLAGQRTLLTEEQIRRGMLAEQPHRHGRHPVLDVLHAGDTRRSDRRRPAVRVRSATRKTRATELTSLAATPARPRQSQYYLTNPIRPKWTSVNALWAGCSRSGSIARKHADSCPCEQRTERASEHAHQFLVVGCTRHASAPRTPSRSSSRGPTRMPRYSFVVGRSEAVAADDHNYLLLQGPGNRYRASARVERH